MKKFLTCIIFLAVAIGAFADAQKEITASCGDEVVITATPKTGYHFVKWNDENTDNPRSISPTADVTYRAYFAINQYTITFLDGDGTELQKGMVNHGVKPEYSGSTPTKASTAEYSYTFSGWNPTIVEATQDQTYTAQFDAEKRKYTITFKNYDGTILQQTEVEYGILPQYIGTTPTKPADGANTYTFIGWTTTIVEVTEDAEYTADYNSTTNTYTITVDGDPADGGTVTGGGLYSYGTEITISATPAECYRFVKWNDGDTNASRTITVSGNITYKAIFEKITYKVTVIADDPNQGDVDGYIKP